MATKSASLLLELSQILSEKAQELSSSAAGTSSSLGINDPVVGDQKAGKRSRFEHEKGSKTWKSGKRKMELSL